MFEITISLYWKRIILKAQDKIFCNEHFKSTLAVSVDIFAKIRACFWYTWWFNKTQIIFKKIFEGVEGKKKNCSCSIKWIQQQVFDPGVHW